MGRFQSPEELIDAFELSVEDYSEILPFTDGSVGFSVIKQYPKNIRYKPPLYENDKPDTVALIRILYYPEDTSKDEATKVHLIIDVSTFSRYLVDHYDYNTDDENSPTEESIKISNRTPKPANLGYYEEYYYNHEKSEIQDSKGKRIDGKKIIEDLYEAHCKTVGLITGIPIRVKIKAHSTKIRIVQWSLEKSINMLDVLFGRTLEKEPTSLKGIVIPYEKSDMRLRSSNSIEFLGYSASKNIIVGYSIIVIVLFIIFYLLRVKSELIYKLSTKPILTLTSSVIVLFMLDYIAPNLLFKHINRLIRKQGVLMMGRIK